MYQTFIHSSVFICLLGLMLALYCIIIMVHLARFSFLQSKYIHHMILCVCCFIEGKIHLTDTFETKLTVFDGTTTKIQKLVYGKPKFQWLASTAIIAFWGFMYFISYAASWSHQSTWFVLLDNLLPYISKRLVRYILL